MPWIAAGGSLLGGLFGSSSAKRAERAQAAAAAADLALRTRMYDEDVERNRPAIEAGNMGRNKLLEMLGLGETTGGADYGSMMRNFSAADLENEPGYQFGMSEGQKSLDRRAAASGGYFSGAALKAAQRFGQDYAGTKYNEAFNRDTSSKTNQYNRLSGLIGGGQTAANQQQASGANYASGSSGVRTNLGNAQADSAIAQGNVWADATNGLLNAYQDYNAQKKVKPS